MQYYYLFKIQHLYLYSTVLFVHKIIIHSKTIYPFNNFLFIQDLLCITLTHGSDVLPAVDEQGQQRSASDHWNFEKIPTAFAQSSAKKG